MKLRKLKKIGIGFGITIGLFFVLVITIGISIEMEKANITPEKLQQLKDERKARAPQKEIDENVGTKSEIITESYQPVTIGLIPMEPSESYMITEDDVTKVKDDSQLDTKDV